MKIEKYSNSYGMFDVSITAEGKILSVSLGGDDVNLSCRFVDFRKITDISFNILEEYGELYSLFERLYMNIVSGNVLGMDERNESVKRSMEQMRSYSWYKEIVNDGVVTIYCDAYPVECPNILRIRKCAGKIELSFEQRQNENNRLPKNPFCINVNVRQDGSKLHDFCYPFKDLYRGLQSVSCEKEKKDVEKRFMIKPCDKF